MLYFDHAASTPLTSKALEVLQNSFAEDSANPAAAHRLGKDLSKRIDIARENFLKAIDGKEQYRFIFTGSATESNNTIISQLRIESSRIIFTPSDHPSTTGPIRKFSTIDIPLNNGGEIIIEKLIDLIDESITFITFASVNNHSGNLHPIEQIAKLIKEKNNKIHIHIDAAQGFAKTPISLKNGYIDSMTVSGHKMGGPKGIAGLYLRKNISINPLLTGGGHEDGFRASTPVAPLIFSWERALIDQMEQIDSNFENIKRLNHKLRDDLKKSIDVIKFPFSLDCTSPYILTFILPNVSADIVLRHLERKNIFVSTSSACSSRQKGINPVFTALHIPNQNHKNVLRISFSTSLCPQDIELFVIELTQIYNDLKLLF